MDTNLKALLVMHPFGRLGDPGDVGNPAVWLASEESACVTGRVYVTYGGRITSYPCLSHKQAKPL
ncbi:SDR family oxidoreductase [Mesorhizobium sp. Cs1299R1N1]